MHACVRVCACVLVCVVSIIMCVIRCVVHLMSVIVCDCVHVIMSCKYVRIFYFVCCMYNVGGFF